MHEVLITEHEVVRTKELGSMFVILPEFLARDYPAYKEKHSFPADALYVSNNPDYLMPLEAAKGLFGP